MLQHAFSQVAFRANDASEDIGVVVMVLTFLPLTTPYVIEWLFTAFAVSGFGIALEVFLSGIGLGVITKVMLFCIT
jgi:hypothetical protein